MVLLTFRLSRVVILVVYDEDIASNARENAFRALFRDVCFHSKRA